LFLLRGKEKSMTPEEGRAPSFRGGEGLRKESSVLGTGVGEGRGKRTTRPHRGGTITEVKSRKKKKKKKKPCILSHGREKKIENSES